MTPYYSKTADSDRSASRTLSTPGLGATSSRAPLAASKAPAPAPAPAPSPPAAGTGAPPTPPATTTVLDHPIAQHALTALRNRQTATPEFRAHCSQLLLVLTLEAMRTMPTANRIVDTAGSKHDGRALAKPVVFLSVTRPALGISSGVSDFIPRVVVGSVSLSGPTHDNERPEARLRVFNSTALSEGRVIIFDPIVATGLSATLALDLVRRSGAKDICLLSFVMSAQGLARVRSGFPGVPIWTAGIDQEWDARQGPLPGIWNFAERVCE